MESDAIGPVVLTINVEVAEPPLEGVTELGLREQVGAAAGVGDTAHVSETGLLKPFTDLIVITPLADCPGLTELSVDDAALMVKS